MTIPNSQTDLSVASREAEYTQALRDESQFQSRDAYADPDDQLTPAQEREVEELLTHFLSDQTSDEV